MTKMNEILRKISKSILERVWLWIRQSKQSLLPCTIHEQRTVPGERQAETGPPKHQAQGLCRFSNCKGEPIKHKQGKHQAIGSDSYLRKNLSVQQE